MTAWLSPEAVVEPGIRDAAVRFTVDGQALAGNLLLPDTAGDLGVVFVHGWSGVRGGPNNLITATARQLARAGFPSLRFDLRGRGESDGAGTATCLPTMSADLEAAVRCLGERTGVRRVVLFGLCSGGNVAIGSLPRLPRTAGLVLLSVYPFSDGDSFGRDMNRTWHYARVYWRKLWRPDTWRRLARGEVRVGQVLNVLFGQFRRRKHEGPAPSSAAAPPPPAAPAAATTEPTVPALAGANGQPGPRTCPSPGVPKAPPKTHLAKLDCGLPALMIYGTADPDAKAALDYYGTFVRERRLPVRFVEIPGANHNYSSCAWMDEIARLTLDFCRERGATR